MAKNKKQKELTGWLDQKELTDYALCISLPLPDYGETGFILMLLLNGKVFYHYDCETLQDALEWCIFSKNHTSEYFGEQNIYLYHADKDKFLPYKE